MFGRATFDFVFVFGRAFNFNRSFLSFNSSLASFFSAFPISFILASFWGHWASSYSSSPLISLSLQRVSISLLVPIFSFFSFNIKRVGLRGAQLLVATGYGLATPASVEAAMGSRDLWLSRGGSNSTPRLDPPRWSKGSETKPAPPRQLKPPATVC